MSLVTCNDKLETVVLKAAFRCKACGHLVHVGHAGERDVPLACPVCGEGVRWNRGAMTSTPENWQVLADCTPAELAEFGLIPPDIERHVPATSPTASVDAGAGVGGSRNLSRSVDDVSGSKDSMKGKVK